VCARCGHRVGSVGEPLAPRLAREDAPVGARGGFGGRYPGSERFVVRHLYCPGCAVQVDVQVARVDDAPIEPLGAQLGD
jgi:N-methylhydantoinase B